MKIIKKDIFKNIKSVKQGREKLFLHKKIYYEPLESYIKNKESIKNIVYWRNKNRKFFIDTASTNIKKTKIWVNSILLDDYKLIFILRALKEVGDPFGMLGVSNFCLSTSSCYLESINKFSAKGHNNFMYLAIENICSWLFSNISIKKVNINCFSDEIKALNLYYRLGFKPVELIPVKIHEKKNIKLTTVNKTQRTERFFLKMEKINERL